MQILHGGRYSYHPLAVAPSALKSPITPFRPRALSSWGVRRTIAAYARCAVLAQRAGYDGVEIMGSEGYLINQFVAPQTNLRDDDWGGSFLNRIRFPVAIVRRTREAVGPNFIIIYRLSMLDLVEGGSSWDEVVALWRSKPPVRRSSTPASAGTRRGSDDRDDGAARHSLGDAAAEGRGENSVDHD